MSKVRKPELGDKVTATMGAPPNQWELTGKVTVLLSAQFMLEGHSHSRLVMYDGEWKADA